MIRSIVSILRSAFSPFGNIRPGERRKTLLMFLYFFFTISLVYILKPVRSSLFIGEFGAEKLPFIYIGEGVWLVLVVWVYTRLARRMTKKALYQLVLLFMVSNLVLFWMFLGRQTAYLSAFFYVWVAAFSITMTTIFWTLANDIFNPDEAKRLFGIIMSGGSLGGILGGVITNMAVHHVGTENLLIVASGILCCCMILVLFLNREISGIDEAHRASANKELADAGGVPAKRESTFKILSGSSYLLMLAAIVIVAKVSSTIVDAQFSKVVEISIQGKEARTAYFGAFWAWLNGISFVMQFFVTGVFLRFLGVGFSLWLLPAGLGFFSLASLFPPLLFTAQLLRIFDGSANYSIQLASKETLYLPLPSALRHRVKPIIDMLGFRSAKTLGGLYILAGAALLHLPYEKLGLLILFLVPLWGWIAWKMKHAYSNLLREYLLDHSRYDKAVEAYDAVDMRTFMHSEKDFEKITQFMSHRSTYARKLAAAAHHAYESSSRDLEATRKIIDRLVTREAFAPGQPASSLEEVEKSDAEFLKSLFLTDAQPALSAGNLQDHIAQAPEQILARVGEALQNPAIGAELKRQAIRILGYMARQDTGDLLMKSLGRTEDHALRFVMIKALNRLLKKNPKIHINRVLIKNEIVREADIHRQITKIRAFHAGQTKRPASESSLDISLNAIMDESVERVFQCLHLLYPGELPASLHEEITSRSREPARGHALELLSNTLDPDILVLVQGILDTPAHPRVRDTEIREILKQFQESRYAWFALMAHFVISDLKLGERWPEFRTTQDTQGMLF